MRARGGTTRTRARKCTASKGATSQPSGPARPSANVGRPASWLIFACYFALFVNDDHGRATEPVSSGDFNTSGKNKECRRLGGSDVEQYFSRRVSAGWSARESKRSFALNCRQDRKELIAAPINDAHENSWVVASRSQPTLL